MTFELLQDELKLLLEGRDAKLPEPLPFRDFVARTRLRANREEAIQFFRQLLDGVSEPNVPFGISTHEAIEVPDEFQIALSPQLAESIQQGARELRVTPAAIFHVAWARFLACVSGRSDVVFGSVLLGRFEGDRGSARGIGPYMNTLPIRLSVDERSVAAAVRETHTLLVKLMEHEHVSLAEVQRVSGVAPPRPCSPHYSTSGIPNERSQASRARRTWLTV
jgi:hypothetical protein